MENMLGGRQGEGFYHMHFGTYLPQCPFPTFKISYVSRKKEESTPMLPSESFMVLPHVEVSHGYLTLVVVLRGE